MVAVHNKRRWHVLERLVNERGWTIGAELGVFCGDTFKYLVTHCPGLTLYGVDLWRPQPEKEGQAGGRSYSSYDLDGYFRDVVRWSIPYRDRAIILRSDTVSAAQSVDGQVDFVFVDADHTYEGVRADFAAWIPKVRKGGMLLGHDYDRSVFPGVVRAVDECATGLMLYPDHVYGWVV